MGIDREDRMLVEALRLYAKGGERPQFPFDDLKFTLQSAADRMENLSQLADKVDESGDQS